MAERTRQVKAERAAALARYATQTRHQPGLRLTEHDIRAVSDTPAFPRQMMDAFIPPVTPSGRKLRRIPISPGCHL